jgi:hypothetical protein
MPFVHRIKKSATLMMKLPSTAGAGIHSLSGDNISRPEAVEQSKIVKHS